MKQKFLPIIALLLMAATGAWAQGYTVTLKDGTEDADNWTIEPKEGLTGNGTETVTITYNGTKRVKSVTAVKKAVAKPDLLPAVFTVDAGKTVKFSKGNLQATYNGSSWIWGFAEHQWDYIGNAAGNTSINGNGNVSANGTVDLFGWVGASSTWTGAAQYGISNSTATNNVDGYGNVAGEAQKVGWGATVGTGWRTLTRPEWAYLLSTRETGITVNSTNHARYTLAIINTDGTEVKGLIIFPDGYTGGTPEGVSWGTINAKSTFETTCTSAGWTALEAAGCVFLPAAGYREASTVKEAGIGGGYWSSSSSYAVSAFGLYFESDYMTIQYGGSRKYGFSVRLVQEVAAEPAGTDLSTINANYTANDGEILTGTLGANVKISIADGATVTLKDVTINGVNTGDYAWAGITCEGDATITLEGTNTVKGFHAFYPGIYVPEGKTLTIEGEGSLNASGNGGSTGIGGGLYMHCGDIVINGGNITATGANYNAGIGGGVDFVDKGTVIRCGKITINGGTVTATGGDFAAGIGCGYYGASNDITITGGTVTATGGEYAAGIGSGEHGSCGAITISGGTVTATAVKWAAGIGGGNENGASGTITITSGVTKVTATKGTDCLNSIGEGDGGAFITVVIEDYDKVIQN